MDLSALKRPIESYEVEISFWASIPPVYTERLFVRGQIPLNPLPQIGGAPQALRRISTSMGFAPHTPAIGEALRGCFAVARAAEY